MRMTGGGEMLKLAIIVGAVLVAAVIVLGTLQAQDEFASGSDPGLATATPIVVATATPAATATVALADSTIVFQVRGGDDPCRYLYMHNRTGTFAGAEIPLVFIAETPRHEFTIFNEDGDLVVEVHMGRNATVQTMIIFQKVGLYKLYDAAYSGPGHVAEIFARPIGQAGYVPVTEWCTP